MATKILDLNLYRFIKRYFPEIQGPNWLVRDTITTVLSNEPLTRKMHEVWNEIAGGIPYDYKKFKVPQGICIVGGRTIGKSLLEALILMHRTFTFNYPLVTGNTARNAILCPSIQSGMPVFDYAAGFIQENEKLAQHLVAGRPWHDPVVKNRQQGLMRFANRTTIEILPVSRCSGRGLSLWTLCLDETAHHRTEEGSRFSDLEVYRSAVPALSRFGNKGFVVMASTPYDKSGLLWQVFRRFFGVSNQQWLTLHVPTRIGNPTITEEFLRQQEEADPEWAKREFEALFTEQANACFAAEAIGECTVLGRERLLYNPEYTYFAFTDPAQLSPSESSAFNDCYAAGVAHIENDVVVIDCLVSFKAEMNGIRCTPDDATAAIINLFLSYKVKDVQSDKYDSGYIEPKFTDAGFKFEFCKLAKSDLYLNAISVLNDKKVELLDDPVCNSQLKRLERRRGRNGRDRVDHLPDRHDDSANVVAGLVHMGLERMKIKPVSFKISDIRIGNYDTGAGTSAGDIFDEKLPTDWHNFFGDM